MKMILQHFEFIRDAMKRTDVRSRQFASSRKEDRREWLDLSVGTKWIKENLEPYLKPHHIDTALRRVASEFPYDYKVDD